MIQIQEYQSGYYDYLEAMYDSQEYTDAREPSESLPSIGFIAFEGSVPIAAGFLRKIEGNYGMIDSLVTNAQSSSELRHEAIDLIVRHLIKSAKHLKMNSILSFSKDKSTLVRSISHGFMLSDKHVMLSLNLKEI